MAYKKSPGKQNITVMSFESIVLSSTEISSSSAEEGPAPETLKKTTAPKRKTTAKQYIAPSTNGRALVGNTSGIAPALRKKPHAQGNTPVSGNTLTSAITPASSKIPVAGNSSVLKKQTPASNTPKSTDKQTPSSSKQGQTKEFLSEGWGNHFSIVAIGPSKFYNCNHCDDCIYKFSNSTSQMYRHLVQKHEESLGKELRDEVAKIKEEISSKPSRASLARTKNEIESLVQDEVEKLRNVIVDRVVKTKTANHFALVHMKNSVLEFIADNYVRKDEYVDRLEEISARLDSLTEEVKTNKAKAE